MRMRTSLCGLSFFVGSALVAEPIHAGRLSRARSTLVARSSSISLSAQPLFNTACVSSAVDVPPAEHPAFKLVKVETVTEYSLKAATYRHVKSGAEVVSVQANDDNKVFGIVFATPVADSTGVPHVLEHSVLCGSDKYTCKEPFAELLKGSLQTFLNAFTYPDRTCYVRELDRAMGPEHDLNPI